MSAGYCLGVTDSDLDYLKAAPTTKTVLRYQEITRNRPLTPLEQMDYEIARSAVPLLKQIFAERNRLHSYLIAKGLFLPGRAQDFLPLLVSIERGKADFYGCVNDGARHNCLSKCVSSHMGDERATTLCAQGCPAPASCGRRGSMLESGVASFLREVSGQPWSARQWPRSVSFSIDRVAL